MKRNILILLLGMIIFPVITNAQSFKASEGIQVAEDKAIELGLTDPQLISIGTMSGAIDGFPIELEFDMETGENVAWLYLFTEKDDPETRKAVGVVRVMIFMAQEISMDMLEGLPVSPDAPLETGWIDSDEFVNNLNANDSFESFAEENDDAVMRLLGLGVNKMNPLFIIDDPYWMAIYGTEMQNITCFVHAETGQAQCLDISDVSDEYGESMRLAVYPNPAVDMVFIKVPENVKTNNYKLGIYDLYGNLVKTITNLPAPCETEHLILPVSDFPSGSYYVLFESENETQAEQLIIVR